MRSLSALWLVVAVAPLAGGCFAMDFSSHERLLTATKDYTQGVRWGRLERASEHLAPELKKGFYERHKTVEDELEFADTEVVNIDVDRSNKKALKATAYVEYAWMLKRRGVLEKTIVVQKWEERGSTWLLVKEERVRGSRNILFDDAL